MKYLPDCWVIFLEKNIDVYKRQGNGCSSHHADGRSSCAKLEKAAAGDQMCIRDRSKGVDFLMAEKEVKGIKKFFEEFKAFAMRGNVIDMAVGVVIGGAFGKITNSVVNDIIMPLISMPVSYTHLEEGCSRAEFRR